MNPQDLGRKWSPKNASELLAAFNAGFLEETHWCDLKRELGSNRESAKDMAAFSIDSGTIVIGIDEKKPDGEPRHPVTLNGLPERLEQIAQTLVRPPLQISCTTIDSGNEDGTGYVLVYIPASALAPHQVDSVYYARSDKTTIRMSEPEVERLYLRREQWNQGVGEMLAGDVAADPFGTLPHKPHLFIAARPVGGWPEMCRDLVSGKDLLGNFKKMTGYLQLDESLRAARARVGGRPHDTILNSLSATGRTQRGAVLSTRMAPPSMEGAQPERVTDVEISEDGEIRFYRSAVGGYRPDSFHEVPDFWIEYTVLAVREVLALAREISTRYGHAAAWDLGMAVTGLHDTRPRTNSGLLDRPGYPGANYSKTTRANVLELEKTPGEVARRLVGGLYRIFNMEDRKYVAIFDDVQAT